jgi:hypothetical protein
MKGFCTFADEEFMHMLRRFGVGGRSHAGRKYRKVGRPSAAMQDRHRAGLTLIANSEQQTANSEQQTANSEQRTAKNEELPATVRLLQ